MDKCTSASLITLKTTHYIAIFNEIIQLYSCKHNPFLLKSSNFASHRHKSKDKIHRIRKIIVYSGNSFFFLINSSIYFVFTPYGWLSLVFRLRNDLHFFTAFFANVVTPFLCALFQESQKSLNCFSFKFFRPTYEGK